MPNSRLSDISFSDLDVYSVLNTLDPSKAMGIDGIGPRILNHCALALYQPIHHLFSLSLSQHYLPEEWRVHCITPIYKSGDKSSVTNYRPISLLCTLSKVLERIIYNAIIDFVANSISPYQFGFLRKHSTLQQLLLFLNNIVNCSNYTDVVYLDFKKAFDSVAHNELLVKLWSFGITGNLWNWFKAYLSSRGQCVSGVPQGSILGHILFINDLPSHVSSSILLFADDTKCYKNINNPNDCLALQNDLFNLHSWSRLWKLNFNESKCAVVRFSPRSTASPPNQIYLINCHPVTPLKCHKDLGILLSRDLSWKQHYEFLSSKAYKILGLLRRTFSRDSSIHDKKILYLSLVKSKLTYCSPVWRPMFLKDVRSIENIQRRATKYNILNDYSSCYRSRLKELHILPLMMQFEIILCDMLKKSY